MITDTGKDILARYLLGHTSSYASHIAVGCGPRPLSFLEDPQDYASEYKAKSSLDFEMFRVPISSRGFVEDAGKSFVVFTAELPTQERYEISELGLYSAGSNPSAGSTDSRLLYSFSQEENWEYHSNLAATEIPLVNTRLDEPGTNLITAPGDVSAFQANSDNVLFTYEDRILRLETPRFLNSSVFVRGDSAILSLNSQGNLVPDESISSHIHLTGTSVNLDSNAPTDQIKFAFSIINNEGDSPLTAGVNEAADPEQVRIMIEFASGETGSVDSAKLDVVLTNGEDGVDFSENRYFVVTKQLQELNKTIGFSWDSVTIVKAYCSVLFGTGLEPSQNYWVALDGIRLENVTTVNPLYGLTGYSVIKNDNGSTVAKRSNTTNFVEFRFAFDTDISESGNS
jgi:hypothetical protein